ncbi:MAG: penicillin-binding transpeptidase domain-containing protein, partial [Oscillospiraceae bacterium]
TSITPLQMAIEASTIANKGTRYNAHLIKGFLTHDMKETVYEKPASIASEFDMSQENYDAITKGMIAAGAGISSPNQLTDLGYQVAVKTGTPQVSSTKTNTAFIAFKPVDKPQVAVSCLLDDGQNCSELIRRILLAYDKHFNTNIQE